MISRSTGDAEAIRQLQETLKRHRGDTEAWSGFGYQLRHQRGQLDPRYRNRTLFVEERCKPLKLTYKFIYDLETRPKDGRRGFSIDKLIDVAAAYGITLGSVGPALDGGDLVPAADQPPVPAWTADPPPEVRMSGVLSDAAIVAAAPLATAILVHLRNFPPGCELPGRKIFLDGTRIPGLDPDRAARRWDDYGHLTEEGRVWLIAALQADMEATARPDSNVG